jgi:hypothetical protein
MPGCEGIDYGEGAVAGTNGLPPGIGRGGYKGTRKPEPQRLGYDKLNLFATASGGFRSMPPVPVIASYGSAGQAPVTDSMIAAAGYRTFPQTFPESLRTSPAASGLSGEIIRTSQKII